MSKGKKKSEILCPYYSNLIYEIGQQMCQYISNLIFIASCSFIPTQNDVY